MRRKATGVPLSGKIGELKRMGVAVRYERQIASNVKKSMVGVTEIRDDMPDEKRPALGDIVKKRQTN